MIWVIFLLLVALVAAYLLQPFLSAKSDPATDARLIEARAQRAAIDADEAAGRLSADAAHEAREALDRRVLELLDGQPKEGGGGRLRTAALYVAPALLLLGGVGLYSQIGQPGYAPLTMAEYQAQQAAELPQSLEGLVEELRTQLAADPNPPAEGYLLLARSNLRLERIEDALAAYERAIDLSEGDARVILERDRVLQALRERENAPAIDPETAARIQSMSPEEQAEMIAGMVEGLAVRLEQDPNDLQGWLRLIRARIVLGDVQRARVDLQTAQSVFANNPEQLAALQPLADELSVPE